MYNIERNINELDIENDNVKPKSNFSSTFRCFSIKKKSTMVVISSLLVLVSCTGVFIKLDGYNLFRAKLLVKNLSIASDFSIYGDGTIGFNVDGNRVNLSLDNNKCEYYFYSNSILTKGSSEDLINIAYFNTIKVAPNSSGNFLLYSVDNYIDDSKSKEFKSSKVSCRYSEIPEGYLLEIYNPNYKKGDLVYFNSDGEVSSTSEYEHYVLGNEESSQVVIPKDFNVDKIVINLVNYLDKR